jgi:nicotinamide-nucleotide amidase
MFDASLLKLAEVLLAECRARNIKIAVAESCTGGWLSAHLTEIAGSSAVFDRGFVTYSNEAKIDMLGVPSAILTQFGAVSEPCARAMAAGVLDNAPEADLSAAITGIAGPGGGSAEKPVGLVHLAIQRRGKSVVHLAARYGDLGRQGIRMAAVSTALEMMLDAAAD